MGYTALDLLDKIIYVIEKKKNICDVELEKMKNNAGIYVLIKVFMKNLDKSITFINALKKEIKKTDMEEIDFNIYDKISFSIHEFSNKMGSLDTFNTKSISKYFLDFQKDVLSLYIYIQGKIVQKQEDINTSTYMVLNTMIVQKKEQIKGLERLNEKYYQFK